MKKLFFLAILLPLALYGQNKLQIDANDNVYMQKIIEAPKYSKYQLFDIAMEWLSETFNSPKDIITFKDKDIGKIKGMFYDDYLVGLVKDLYSNTFSIWIKNGKIKIRIDNIREVTYNYPIERNIVKKKNKTFRNYAGLTKDVQLKLNNLINNFESYIKNYSQENNW